MNVVPVVSPSVAGTQLTAGIEWSACNRPPLRYKHLYIFTNNVDDNPTNKSMTIKLFDAITANSSLKSPILKPRVYF